jgi:hypothetical protein
VEGAKESDQKEENEVKAPSPSHLVNQKGDQHGVASPEPSSKVLLRDS